MRVDNNTGRGTSGMDKFRSTVYRMHIELGSKFPDSLRRSFLEGMAHAA